MKKPFFIVVIVMLAAMGGLVAQRKVAGPQGITITKQQMEYFLSKFPAEEINKYKNDPEGKKKFADQIRQFLAIGQEGQRRGVLSQADVKGKLEFARKQVLVDTWKQLVPEAKSVVISKEETDKFYKDNPNAFTDFLNQNPEMKNRQGVDQFKNTYAELCLLSTRAEAAKIGDKPEFQFAWMIRQSQVAVDKVLPELEKQIKVEDAEVKAYYESHKTDYEEVKASHILISTNPPTPPPPPPADPKDPKAKEAKPAETPKALTKEEARKKAEDLLKQIQGGADFAKLAAENSDDPGSKTQGGDLGFFKKGQMVKPFEETAFKLKAGELSATVVESQFGFHIIKVMERRVPPIDKPMEKEIQDTVKQKQIEKLLDRIAEDNRISVAADFTFPKGEEAPEMGMPPGHP